MATCAQLRGIKLVDEDYLVRVELVGSVDESAPFLNSDGSPVSAGAIDTFNSRNRATIEGKGALPAGMAAGTSDLVIVDHEDGVTGISVTEEVQETGAHHSFTVEATNWPHAILPV